MSKIPRRIPGELSKALKSTPPGMVIEADPANIMIWNVTIAGPVCGRVFVLVLECM